jgi:hypothetical protein
MLFEQPYWWKIFILADPEFYVMFIYRYEKRGWIYVLENDESATEKRQHFSSLRG